MYRLLVQNPKKLESRYTSNPGSTKDSLGENCQSCCNMMRRSQILVLEIRRYPIILFKNIFLVNVCVNNPSLKCMHIYNRLTLLEVIQSKYQSGTSKAVKPPKPHPNLRIYKLSDTLRNTTYAIDKFKTWRHTSSRYA